MAERRIAVLPVEPADLTRKGLSLAIEMAVRTISDEVPAGDDVLYDLLVACLGDVRTPTEPERVLPAPRPQQLP